MIKFKHIKSYDFGYLNFQIDLPTTHFPGMLGFHLRGHFVFPLFLISLDQVRGNLSQAMSYTPPAPTSQIPT